MTNNLPVRNFAPYDHHRRLDTVQSGIEFHSRGAEQVRHTSTGHNASTRNTSDQRAPIPARMSVSFSFPVMLMPVSGQHNQYNVIPQPSADDLLRTYMNRMVDPVTGNPSNEPNAIRQSAFIVRQSASPDATRSNTQ